MNDSTPSPSTGSTTEKSAFITGGEPPRGMERVRLAVPDALVPTLVRLRIKRKLARGVAVEKAREEMAWLLDGVRTPEQIDDAALAYVERDTWRSELRWHPALVNYQEVEGTAHLTRARKLGRGVVISFLHHGHYEGAMASIAHAEAPIHIAISPDMIGPDAPTFLRQHVRTGIQGGNTGVNVGGGANVLVEQLLAGHALAIASDVPGKTPVTFLGKERRGSSGAARLAQGTNSPVVVMTAHQEAGTVGLRLSEPIEPRDFADQDALLAHLIAAQEDAVLAWPAGYHQPRLRWGRTEAEEAAAGPAHAGGAEA